MSVIWDKKINFDYCFSGEDRGYSERALVIYDGIHYDPQGGNGSVIQKVFPVTDERILVKATHLARQSFQVCMCVCVFACVCVCVCLCQLCVCVCVSDVFGRFIIGSILFFLLSFAVGYIISSGE